MEKELKEKWVAALRSGKYEQGQGFLRKGNTFCCWGVLVDIVDPRWSKQEQEEVYGHISSRNYGMPDATLYEKIKVPYDPGNGLLISTSVADELASMNDNGKTFEEIADVIEREL